MRRVIATFGMLAACDTIYGLRDRPVADGAIGDDGMGSADAAKIDGPMATHDEDHDTFLDGDDNCPGLPNVDQMDADNDDIGDVCDPLTSFVKPNRRLLFDPFTTLDTKWTPNALWTTDGESVGPAAGQPNNNEAFRLTHQTVMLAASSVWSIDVGIDLPSQPEIAKFIGVHPVDVTSSSSWLCAVSFTGAEWSLTAGNTGTITPALSPLIVRTRGTGATADTNTCSTVFGAETSAMLQPVPYPLFPQLYSFTVVRFQFIDVIQ